MRFSSLCLLRTICVRYLIAFNEIVSISKLGVGVVKVVKCGHKKLMNGVVNLDVRMIRGKVCQPSC